MKFSDHSAVVSLISDQLTDERDAFGEGGVSIAGAMQAGRVKPRHEAASARGADRALTISVGKSSAILNEGIDHWRFDIGVSEGSDGVEALLISAIPKNVGAFHEKGGSKSGG